MIIEKKKIKLESTCGDTLTYTISHDGSCMSISPATGTANDGDIIEFTFSLDNEECYDSTITLTYEDSEGVSGDPYTFSLDNSCSLSGVLSNQPTATNPYVFILNVTATSNYTTTWDYDTTIFDVSGTTNNSIELQLINEELLDTTQIKATVTDSIGCTTVATYNYAFCEPTATNLVANLVCIPELSDSLSLYSSGRTNLQLNVNACSGKTIDWDTLVLSYDTSKLLVTQDETDGSIIKVYARASAAGRTYDITYKVKDSDGLFSNEAYVRVTGAVCETINYPVTPINTTELNPADVFGTELNLDIEDNVFSGRGIDWSTFTFIANTGQTLVSANELTTNNGSAIFDAGNREIDYTVGTQTENVDLVEYKFADIDGNPSNRGLWYINYETKAVPVVTNDSYTVAKESTTELTILSNDTGDLDINSVEILTFPTKGALFNNGDGTFNYVADNTSGADSFTYQVYDTDGRASNIGTVSITIESSGTGSTATICKTAGIDLSDYLVGSITAGGSWAADVSNPSAPSIADPSNVDFSSANVGTYYFTYTAGSDEATITLIIADNGYNIVSQFVGNTGVSGTPANTPYVRTIMYDVIGISSRFDIYASVDFNSGTSTTIYYPDETEFYPEYGVAQIDALLESGAGDYEVTIVAVDVCGVTHTSPVYSHTVS